MKKILTLALTMAVAGSMMAQKQVVDQASKLSGKTDKIAEARSLIDQAKNNAETKNDARTYYVAGKIELDAFDEGFKKKMINPNDASVSAVDMGQQLLNAYNNFIQALPLDSVPDDKGKVKPKFAKEIISKLNGHFNDFFNAGGSFYNEKKYYPEAYTAFMVYGTMPQQPWADKSITSIPDSVINTGFFNAGLSAYAANQLEPAAKAFKAARLNNTDNPNTYIYELACWQYIANGDSTKLDEAKQHIEEVSKAGYEKFGMSQPIFVNNLINSLVLNNKMNDALALVDNLIAKPGNDNKTLASLYGLRGFVNDRAGNDDASIADYRKAAETPDVDFETLKNAAKKIFRAGTTKWNSIEGAAPEQRNDLKVNYFEYAKKLTDRAKEMNSDDTDLNYVIESVDYALTTFFN